MITKCHFVHVTSRWWQLFDKREKCVSSLGQIDATTKLSSLTSSIVHSLPQTVSMFLLYTHYHILFPCLLVPSHVIAILDTEFPYCWFYTQQSCRSDIEFPPLLVLFSIDAPVLNIEFPKFQISTATLL